MVDHAQAIVRRPMDLEGLQALVAADTVLGMDHQVVFIECRDFGQEVFRTPAAGGGARQAFAEDVLLADHRQRRGAEALVDLEGRKAGGARRQRVELVPARRRRQAMDAVLIQQMGQAVERALGMAGH